MLISYFVGKRQLMTFTIILLFLSNVFLGCKKEIPFLKSPESISSITTLTISYQNSPYVVGTDITALLQSEVTAQKRIEIPKGIYYISKPITKNKGSININSDGAILQMITTFPSGKKNLSAGLVLTSMDSVAIEGITIDGNRANLVNAGINWTNYIMGIEILGSSNIRLNNCSVINGPSISFNIKDSKNIDITNCTSVNGMYHGIVFEYCSNASVSNSKIIGIGNQGIDPRKGGIGILGIGGNYLTFTNNDIENISDTGTKTEGSNYVIWDGNTLKNCGKDGIKFQNLVAGENPVGQPVLEFATNAKIINNTIDQIYNGRNDGSSLVQIWNAHNVEVIGNIISGGSKTGQEDGVCVWSTTSIKTSNITISGNTIKNTNRFIYLSNVIDAAISENNCENFFAPKRGYDGLAIEYSDRITVTNNIFRRSATGVIDGFAAKMYESTNFIFKNNRLENAYSAIGLRLATSESANVTDNKMDNLSSYAVLVYAGTSGTVLNSLIMAGNTITRTGTSVGYNAVISVDPTNFMINNLDFSNTKITGDAKFGDVGLQVKSILKKVEILNLKGFEVTGNVFYPAPVDLTACNTVIKY
jgi:hypothetical protein